jgi:lysophospholipase L1-like esterase
LCAGEPGQPILKEGFESDPFVGGWLPTGAGEWGKTVVWSDKEPCTGSHCLRLIAEEGKPTDLGLDSPPLKLTPGQYYRVRFQSRADRRIYWEMRFYDEFGALLEGDYNTSVESSADWQPQEFFFKPVSRAATAGLGFRTLGPANASVDDVELTPATDAQLAAWIARLDKAVGPFRPLVDKNVADRLPHTRALLKAGKPVRILVLGDSISNDLSTSDLELLLRRAWPKSKIDVQFVGRPSTGWSRHARQIEQRLVRHKGDLILMLAISNDPQDMQRHLEKIVADVRKASPKTEVALVTPHIEGWYGSELGAAQAAELRTFAERQHVALIDVLENWQRYLAKRDGKVDPLMRDILHMNDLGRALTARIVAANLGGSDAAAAEASTPANVKPDR